MVTEKHLPEAAAKPEKLTDAIMGKRLSDYQTARDANAGYQPRRLEPPV